MSKTLARQIRRIGILPTTYHTVTETRLVKDENGKEQATEVKLSVPTRNRMRLSLTELQLKRDVLVADWRKRRKRRKARG